MGTQDMSTTMGTTTARTTTNSRTRKLRILLAVVGATLVVTIAVLSVLWLLRPSGESNDALQALIDAGALVDTLPEDVWADNAPVEETGFTPREALGLDVDAIGLLTIEKISVSIQVYDSEDTMEDMKKGASHYRASSYWNGNVAMAAHNGNASYSWFERLDELEPGDIVQYETNLGLRQYQVDDIRVIEDTDWSVIDRTEKNCITMTTCIDGREDKRLCVRATEV